MTYQHIAVCTEGPVAEIVLDRPDNRNAMTAAMGTEVQRAVAELNGMNELRAVLIRGRGTSFSAGGDLDMIEARTRCGAEENRVGMEAFYRLFLSVRDLRVPTIAVLHGHAIGAAVCLALGCDIRLAAEDAKLGLTFVRVGLHPGMGATWLLPRLVGTGKAAELLLTGRVFGAAEAVRIGLVNAVYPADELVDAARTLANEIAAAAPIAVSQTAATLRRAPATLDQALRDEAAAQAIDYGSADVLEAIDAFRNRRSPRFSEST